MSSLEGRVALVTGGTKGIGKAIVEEFVKCDARVVYCARNDPKERIEGATFVRADVTNPSDQETLIKETVGLGGIHILVNNAGTRNDAYALRTTQEKWRAVFALNLDAPFTLSRLAFRYMIRQEWGRIINVGSIGAHVGMPGQTSYTASKAGLEGLTRSLAAEGGIKGITVNTVNPGFIHTELTQDVGELEQLFVKLSALQRLVKPREVANVVAFLASDEASGLTGQSINVDAGTLRM